MRGCFSFVNVAAAGCVILSVLKPVSAPAMAKYPETVEQQTEEANRLRRIAPPHDFFSTADKDIYAVAVAIHAGQPLDEQALQKLGSRIDEPGSNKLTLLYYAAYLLNLDATAALLKAGADPLFPSDDEGKYLWPNLVSATAVGNRKLSSKFLQILLDNGVDPNLKPAPDKIPLVALAARWGREDNFKILVDRGANPWAMGDKARGESPYSAMSMAAVAGHYEMLAYAIDHGALKDIPHERIAELTNAIDNVWLRDDATSRALVAVTRKIVETSGYAGDAHTAYILGFGQEHFSSESLSTDQSRVEEEEWPPFDSELSAAANKIEMGEPLTEADIASIKNKINKPYHSGSLLSIAARRYEGDLHNIEVLFAAGVDPNTARDMAQGQDTFVSIAFIGGGYANHSKAPLRALYFKHHGDPNARLYRFGLPLVAEAARYRSYQSVKELIDAGADLWAEPRVGNSVSAMEQLALNARHEGGPGAYEREGFSEPVAWQLIGYAAEKGLFSKAPPERLRAFMTVVTGNCPYFKKFPETVAPALRKIIEQTGYTTDDACISQLAASE